MDAYINTLICVAIMLAYMLPGYIFVKIKSVPQESISSFAKVLMYVCQPCLTVYAFNKILVSDIKFDNGGLFANLGIIFGLSFVVMLAVIAVFYFAFRKKYADVKYRVCTVAAAFGNCTFMGIPILEAVFPNNPEVALYSTAFFFSMSLIGWTAASALITGDKKYINVKNFLLNPAVVALAVALPLYFTNTALTGQLGDMVTLLGKMTTPMCMLVIGMRLGAVKIKPIFTSAAQYVSIAVKLAAMPLIMLAVVYFLPIGSVLKISLVTMSACPCASIVLNFAEMLHSGQETAVNVVLLSTFLCVATLPSMCLLATALL